MSSFVLVAYYMTKEAIKPHMHHSNFKEYFDDVEIDCFRRTHSFKHMKYIRSLCELIKDY